MKNTQLIRYGTMDDNTERKANGFKVKRYQKPTIHILSAQER